MRTICAMMVTALFLLPAAANAVTVGCAGATGTFDFNSISAAVNVVPDGVADQRVRNLRRSTSI